jgi:hypothetical protein
MLVVMTIVVMAVVMLMTVVMVMVMAMNMLVGMAAGPEKREHNIAKAAGNPDREEKEQQEERQKGQPIRSTEAGKVQKRRECAD